MYARLTKCQVKQGGVDQFISIYRESIMPAMKEQRGFNGAHVLTDRKNNNVIAVAIWKTESDMLANEKSGYYSEQLAKIKPTLAVPSVREIYEVSVDVPAADRQVTR